MKDALPGWPQTSLIVACGLAFVFLGCLLSSMRDDWGASAWLVLVLLVLFGLGFLVSLLVFYLRPQHGATSVPRLLAFLLGHAALVALLWRIGVFGR